MVFFRWIRVNTQPLIVQVRFSSSRQILAGLLLTLLFVSSWCCCHRDPWTNDRLLYVLSYTPPPSLLPPHRRFPAEPQPARLCQNLIWLAGVDCLACSISFSLKGKFKTTQNTYSSWIGKGKTYVEVMIKINLCIFMALNKEQNSRDVGTNGQLLTLANIPLPRVYVVSAE